MLANAKPSATFFLMHWYETVCIGMIKNAKVYPHMYTQAYVHASIWLNMCQCVFNMRPCASGAPVCLNMLQYASRCFDVLRYA